jgi:hypothetical protein
VSICVSLQYAVFDAAHLGALSIVSFVNSGSRVSMCITCAVASVVQHYLMVLLLRQESESEKLLERVQRAFQAADTMETGFIPVDKLREVRALLLRIYCLSSIDYTK